MATQEAPPSPTEADAEEIELEIDGAAWRARVLGRAGGTVPSRVPMLLLGFWPDGEVEGEPVRESLVVGHTLEGLSAADLERAFRSGRAPLPRGEDADTRSPRSRGRRGGRGGRGGPGGGRGGAGGGRGG